MCPCGTLEDSPSGLWRTLGKRVGLTPSGVRIPYPPRWLAPRPFAGEQAILVGYENPGVVGPRCWRLVVESTSVFDSPHPRG